MYVEALILYIGGSNAGPLREFDLFRVRGLPVHMLEVISHSKMFDFYSPLQNGSSSYYRIHLRSVMGYGICQFTRANSSEFDMLG